MYNNCRTHTTKTQLPEDIITILDSIHDNAKSMSASTYPVRRKKGELLKQFLFELKCHKGNMEEIHGRNTWIYILPYPKCKKHRANKNSP